MMVAEFRLYRYLSFDDYVAAQVAANAEKLDEVWVRETTIADLARYLQGEIGPVKSGLCHGTRGGQEQAWFRKYLPGADVIGTEIAPTARAVPYTVWWDFHEIRPEWIGAKDFVYSNSFDHAYDPERALTAWVDCLRPGGLCLIEHSPAHNAMSESDPFAATPAELQELIDYWGAGHFGVVDVLPAPAAKAGGSVLVVGRAA